LTPTIVVVGDGGHDELAGDAGGDVASTSDDFPVNSRCYCTYHFRQLPFHHL
jgi:hypothetical protein